MSKKGHPNNRNNNKPRYSPAELAEIERDIRSRQGNAPADWWVAKPEQTKARQAGRQPISRLSMDWVKPPEEDAQIPEHLQKIIDALRTSTSPDSLMLEIGSEQAKLRIKPSARQLQAMEDNRVEGHANLIVHLLETVPQTLRVTHAAEAIDKAIILLTRRQKLNLALERTGTKTLGELRSKVKDVLDAANAALTAQHEEAARVAEARRVEDRKLELIRTIQNNLRIIASDACIEPRDYHKRIKACLAELGDDQSRAFPPDIDTQEKMLSHVDGLFSEAVLKIRAREEERERVRRSENARDYFDHLDTTSHYRQNLNPDAKVQAIHIALHEAGGTIIDLWRKGDQFEKTETAIMHEIDRRHTARVLDIMYAQLEMEHGIEIPVLNFMDDPLVVAAACVEIGHSPNSCLEEFEALVAHGRALMNEETANTVASIRQIERFNTVMHFAHAAYAYHEQGNAHEVTTVKAIRQITAYGGYDLFTPYIARVGISEELWGNIREFLGRKTIEFGVHGGRTVAEQRLARADFPVLSQA